MAIIKDKAAFIEALKEFLRIVLIAAVSAALAGAANLVGLLDPFWATVVTTLLTFIGKAWDKYIHKSTATTLTGITGF